ncbi:hypothetical protein AV553_22710 [Salmonella enterica]|nr:hypothetical protein [Salmonella enterica]
MKFIDLPLSIQEVAAHTLRNRITEIGVESATKETIDNMAHNVRDAFNGLYSVSVEDTNISEEKKENMDFHKFWKHVEAIAKANLLELNNLYHREKDSHQSSHHQGIVTLIALMKEQDVYRPESLNDTAQ